MISLRNYVMKTPSLFNNSFASDSYACAPTEDGEYAEIGRPYEGASARRILRGTILLKTCPGKWLLTSLTTSEESRVRGSNIVNITPRTCRSGKRADWTRWIVCVNCPSPSNARYSH